MSEQEMLCELTVQGLQSLDERVQDIMQSFGNMLYAIGKSHLTEQLPWSAMYVVDNDGGGERVGAAIFHSFLVTGHGGRGRCHEDTT